MGVRWIAAAAAGTALALAPAQPGWAAAPVGMVPGGSYLDSCKEITFDPATNRLNATCDFNDPEFGLKGEPVRSSEGFDISGCVENSIFNDNGSLYCFTKAPWGYGHAIPEGSYRASCTRSHVVNNVLIAECDDSSDETHFTEVNLSGCRWGGDISNQDGNLRCEAAAAAEASSPPVVRPVSIAPVMAKPITMAPVSAAPGGTTTADGPRKREKKKRDRGERG